MKANAPQKENVDQVIGAIMRQMPPRRQLSDARSQPRRSGRCRGSRRDTSTRPSRRRNSPASPLRPDRSCWRGRGSRPSACACLRTAQSLGHADLRRRRHGFHAEPLRHHERVLDFLVRGRSDAHVVTEQPQFDAGSAIFFRTVQKSAFFGPGPPNVSPWGARFQTLVQGVYLARGARSRDEKRLGGRWQQSR